MSLRSDIPDLQRHFVAELVLEIEIVVLHIRRARVTIHDKGITLEIGTSRGIEYRLTGGYHVTAAAHRRNDLRRPDRIVSRTGIIERWVREMPKEEILREGVVEHSPACAQYRFPLTAHVPGQAEARSEIPVVGLIQSAESPLSYLCQREGLVRGVERSGVTEKIVLL